MSLIVRDSIEVTAPVHIDSNGRPVYQVYGTFDCDSAYPTGGYDVSNVFGPSIAGSVAVIVVCPDKGGYSFEYDPPTKKMKVFASGTTNAPENEVVNGTDLSAMQKIGFMAVGYQ